MIAQGTPGQLETDPRSVIGPFLAGTAAVTRDRKERPAPVRQIALEVGDLYNLHDVSVAFPLGSLCFVGVALLSRIFLGEAVGRVRCLKPPSIAAAPASAGWGKSTSCTCARAIR